MEPIILPRISDQKPLVSVVSITYNHEPYIRDCLEGFLMQKTNFPVEVIIHDDASTDHTADIIREYYEKRPDLFHVIIERENQYSKGKSFSYLYNMAKGKYIALCEGDDYWTDPLKLQKQFDFMEKNSDCSVCFHNAVQKNVMRNNRNAIQYTNQHNRYYSLEEVIALGGGLMITATMFFKKKGITNLKRVKKDCPVGDHPLSIFLATEGKVFYNKDIMSVYRVNALGSWTRRFQNKEKKSMFIHNKIRWEEELRKEIKAKDAFDYIISRDYFDLYSILRKRKDLYSDKYCKIMYRRLSVKGKILWHIWGYIIVIISIDKQYSILRRLAYKYLYRRIMDEDKWMSL